MQINIDKNIEEMIDRLMDLDVDSIDDEALDRKLKLAEKVCQLGEISIKSREQRNKESELELTNKKLNLEALKLADAMNVTIPEQTILEIAYDGRRQAVSEG